MNDNNNESNNTFFIASNVSLPLNFTGLVNPNRIQKLNLFDNSLATITGNNDNVVLIKVIPDQSCPMNHIRIPESLHLTLQSKAGDKITLAPHESIQYCTALQVEPQFETNGKNFSKEISDYFSSDTHPVSIGSLFIITTKNEKLTFKVTNSLPGDRCIASRSTKIYQINPASSISFKTSYPIKFSDLSLERLTYEQIKKYVCLPLQKSSLIQTARLPTPNGVLILGKRGSGKTSLLSAIGHSLDSPYAYIDFNRLILLQEKEAIDKLKKCFSFPIGRASSLLLFDDIDILFEKIRIMPYKRIAAFFIAFVDRLLISQSTVIVATAKSTESLGSYITRYGRFGFHIKLGQITHKQIVDIIKTNTAGFINFNKNEKDIEIIADNIKSSPFFSSLPSSDSNVILSAARPTMSSGSFLKTPVDVIISPGDVKKFCETAISNLVKEKGSKNNDIGIASILNSDLTIEHFGIQRPPEKTEAEKKAEAEKANKNTKEDKSKEADSKADSNEENKQEEKQLKDEANKVENKEENNQKETDQKSEENNQEETNKTESEDKEKIEKTEEDKSASNPEEKKPKKQAQQENTEEQEKITKKQEEEEQQEAPAKPSKKTKKQIQKPSQEEEESEYEEPTKPIKKRKKQPKQPTEEESEYEEPTKTVKKHKKQPKQPTEEESEYEEPVKTVKKNKTDFEEIPNTIPQNTEQNLPPPQPISADAISDFILEIDAIPSQKRQFSDPFKSRDAKSAQAPSFPAAVSSGSMPKRKPRQFEDPFAGSDGSRKKDESKAADQKPSRINLIEIAANLRKEIGSDDYSSGGGEKTHKKKSSKKSSKSEKKQSSQPGSLKNSPFAPVSKKPQNDDYSDYDNDNTETFSKPAINTQTMKTVENSPFGSSNAFKKKSNDYSSDSYDEGDVKKTKKRGKQLGAFETADENRTEQLSSTIPKRKDPFAKNDGNQVKPSHKHKQQQEIEQNMNLVNTNSQQQISSSNQSQDLNQEEFIEELLSNLPQSKTKQQSAQQQQPQQIQQMPQRKKANQSFSTENIPPPSNVKLTPFSSNQPTTSPFGPLPKKAKKKHQKHKLAFEKNGSSDSESYSSSDDKGNTNSKQRSSPFEARSQQQQQPQQSPPPPPQQQQPQQQSSFPSFDQNTQRSQFPQRQITSSDMSDPFMNLNNPNPPQFPTAVNRNQQSYRYQPYQAQQLADSQSMSSGSNPQFFSGNQACVVVRRSKFEDVEFDDDETFNIDNSAQINNSKQRFQLPTPQQQQQQLQKKHHKSKRSQYEDGDQIADNGGNTEKRGNAPFARKKKERGNDQLFGNSESTYRDDSYPSSQFGQTPSSINNMDRNAGFTNNEYSDSDNGGNDNFAMRNKRNQASSMRRGDPFG